MRWGAAEGRAAAAARLIAGEGRDIRALREAIRILVDDRAGFVHRLRSSGAGVVGWLAWVGQEVIGLGLEDSEGEWTVELAPDPSLALAGEGYQIVEVEIPEVLRVFDPQTGAELFRRRSSTPFVDRRAAAAPDASALSVIVPIYDGLAASEACLDSLFAQKDIVFSIILVDDAAPDPQLSALAEAAARRPGVTLLRNDVNLGFAGSINRALAISGRDDVVLLNADTILPPRAITRLHALLANDRSVGTATPFSNNSQLTSFPRPFVVNALPSPAEIAEIDDVAFAVNGAGLVDMPSGIGFCMYISRACLEATGPLPMRYGRGYYEDTEYCLIARERGFRNVCATGVFVGHAGSVSFKSDKRALVSRNLTILEDRFPRQSQEFLAFAQADPLRSARAAIEERLPLDRQCTLIMTSEGHVQWLARQRAKEIYGLGQAAIVLGFSPDGFTVQLRRAEEGAPASLSFQLDASGEQRLTAYLRGLDVRVVEIFDAGRAPDRLWNAVSALGAPIDLFCVDLCGWRRPQAQRWGACETPLESNPCERCAETYAPNADASQTSESKARWARALSEARSVRSVDRMGAALARQMFGPKAQPPESEPDEVREVMLAETLADPHVLGVLAPVASVESDRLLVRLSRKLPRRGDGFRMVVLGNCLNEEDILAAGFTVVIRPGDPDEYLRLAQLFRVGRLALLDRTCLFGPLDRLARQIGAPKAYFDWSFGALEASPRDLAMDPRVCDEKAASAVAFWVNSD